MNRPARLSDDELHSWLASHTDWTLQDNHLLARFALSYDKGLEVLNMVRDNIAESDHHPRATLEFRSLTVELWTHDRDGVTELDTTLAVLFSRAVQSVKR